MLARGDQAPLSAVSVSPTCGVPVTVGARRFIRVPGTTGPDDAAVTTASVYPTWCTLTRTEMVRRTSAAVGVYVVWVAPAIGCPSASHWRATVPAGAQLPVVAVNTWSTCGVPVTVGGVVALNCPGATAA